MIGGILVTIGVALSIWWGVSASRGISWEQAQNTVVSNTRVSVTFDVINQNNRPVTCTLIAYDLSHTQVGKVDVHLPGSHFQSTRYTRTVQTAAPAVTGMVDHCALG
ncbi:hypothetical protein GCM10027579_00180 [Calidifontibacter terrae]